MAGGEVFERFDDSLGIVRGVLELERLHLELDGDLGDRGGAVGGGVPRAAILAEPVQVRFILRA